MPPLDVSALGRHELEAYARALFDQRHEDNRLNQLYAEAARTWGSEHQLRLLQEECGELVVAINRHTRGRVGLEAVVEEIADVEIMCEQVRRLVGAVEVNKAKRAKLERLAARVESGLDV